MTSDDSTSTPTGRYLPTDSASRKRLPMCSGLLDYFVDALAAVAEVSWFGNEKHNPGQPIHHSRGKSADHADCIMRHLAERGGFDVIVVEGVQHRIRHSAYLAWRALALLQEELEHDLGLSLPRGAWHDAPPDRTADVPVESDRRADSDTLDLHAENFERLVPRNAGIK